MHIVETVMLAAKTADSICHTNGTAVAPATPPREAEVASAVELRPIPYPYRAMLAICSDLDNTPNWRVYWEIMRFLNTTQNTALGPGVGLEVGNSLYFDMPSDEFAYWNTPDAGRTMVRALIHSGHIDCLHSYGDLATTRRRAGAALDELTRHDCQIQVWVDHRVAPTNFGADIMRGSGDVPRAVAYHADLTCGFGVQYVWRGRVTSVIGQDAPRRLSGIFAARRPLRSARTIAKEAAKGLLGRRHHAQYAMHGSNELLRRAQLRDGRPVYEFLRSNPSPLGVENADTAAGLAQTLTPHVLGRLIARGGVGVFYTHLGKGLGTGALFDPQTQSVFRSLAELHRAGSLLVTTTRRLLGYRRAARELQLRTTRPAGDVWIDANTCATGADGAPRLAASDLDGLTFYVSDPQAARVRIDGREVHDLRRNGPDHTGRRSVSLPTLECPRL
jgi:hypothetical protein